MADALAISVNPAIDRVALAPGAAGGGVVRATEALQTPGGKGAHVALVGRALGADVRLLSTRGGDAGDLFARLVEAAGVPAVLVPVASQTRGTYTVVDPDHGDVVEIHEPSGSLTAAEADALVAAAGAELVGCRVAVVAGSVPPGAAPDLPARLIAAAGEAGAFSILDCSTVEALARGLAQTPDLVAPNAHEATALLGQAVDPTASLVELAAVADALRSRGARAAWLSLGPRGSLLASGDGTWHLQGPPAVAVNAVGCGDALVAGLAAGLVRGQTLVASATLGVAAATDKLVRLHPGQVDPARVAGLVPSVVCERVR